MKTYDQVVKFIKKQKVAFIASVSDEGFPNLKAMLMPRKVEGRCFYFSTNTSSMRVWQYRKNSKAAIYFYHKGLVKYEGVMLEGVMEVVEEQETKNECWKIGDKMFYKQGKEDPDYCILKFTTAKARYYCDLHTEDVPVQ